MSEHLPCRLGRIEYDGARYCHERGGFLEPGVQSMQCALAPKPCAYTTSTADYCHAHNAYRADAEGRCERVAPVDPSQPGSGQ